MGFCLNTIFIYNLIFFARKLFCSLLSQSLRREQLWKQEPLNYNPVPFPVHVPTLKTEKSIIFIKIPLHLSFIATYYDLGLRTEKSAFYPSKKSIVAGFLLLQDRFSHI
jgi:hypothetical protein